MLRMKPPVITKGFVVEREGYLGSSEFVAYHPKSRNLLKVHHRGTHTRTVPRSRVDWAHRGNVLAKRLADLCHELRKFLVIRTFTLHPDGNCPLELMAAARNPFMHRFFPKTNFFSISA